MGRQDRSVGELAHSSPHYTARPFHPLTQTTPNTDTNFTYLGTIWRSSEDFTPDKRQTPNKRQASNKDSHHRTSHHTITLMTTCTEYSDVKFTKSVNIRGLVIWLSYDFHTSRRCGPSRGGVATTWPTPYCRLHISSNMREACCLCERADLIRRTNMYAHRWLVHNMPHNYATRQRGGVLHGMRGNLWTRCAHRDVPGRSVSRGFREDRLELYPRGTKRRGTAERFEFWPIRFQLERTSLMGTI